MRPKDTEERELAVSDDLKIVLRVLKSESLDWYFAHHGFEQRWEEDVELLRKAYFTELADALSKAGPIYDKWEELRTTRDEGYLTQEETKAYSAELEPLDASIYAFFCEATHLDVG